MSGSAAFRLSNLLDFPFRDSPRSRSANGAVRSEMPFVVVCDVRLRGKSGLEWLSDLRRLDQDLPVILITGHGDISMAVHAMRNGAYDFIEKPCSSEQLVSVVRRAAEKRRLTLEVRSLRSALADRQGIEASLLGRSPQIQEVRRLVSTLAANQCRRHDLWGNRNRQGRRCALSPQSQRATRRPLCRGELRRPSRIAGRERVVRP